MDAPGTLDSFAFDRANAFQRFNRGLASTAAGSWFFARVLDHVDRPVYRRTRGRQTLTSLLSGLPVVMLTTTGARSGARHSVPLLGLPTAEGLVVIASNYGQRKHPAWYHNLRADPRAEVTVGDSTRAVRARQAEGEERERIWQQGLRVYPAWTRYAGRASNRSIGIFVLEPTD